MRINGVYQVAVDRATLEAASECGRRRTQERTASALDELEIAEMNRIARLGVPKAPPWRRAGSLAEAEAMEKNIPRRSAAPPSKGDGRLGDAAGSSTRDGDARAAAGSSTRDGEAGGAAGPSARALGVELKARAKYERMTDEEWDTHVRKLAKRKGLGGMLIPAKEREDAQEIKGRTPRMAFAGGLKAARLAAGYSQEGLASALGLCNCVVTLWESGLNMPNRVNAERLEDLLGGGLAGLAGAARRTRWGRAAAG